MASTKISALTAATTLTGTEVIPLVQGGTTKKVTSDQFLIKDASGNVGVGTASPGSKLDVSGIARSVVASGHSFRALRTSDFYYLDVSADGVDARSNFNGSAPMLFKTGGTECARIDASGNLGLGVTPSAWGSYYKAIESTTASEFCITSQNNGIEIGRGYYKINDGFGSVYTTGQAPSKYYQDGSGGHNWYTAPSGTAGNPISFTQAMTLGGAATPYLLVGHTTNLSSWPFQAKNQYGFAVHNAGSTAVAAYFAGGGNVSLSGAGSSAVINGTDGILLGVGGTERARIDASGNFIVGASSQTIISPKKIQFYNTGASEGLIESADDISSFPSIGLSKTAVKFYTNNTLAAQFDASGNLLVGTTSVTNSPAQGVQLTNVSSIGAVFVGHANGTATGNYYSAFSYNAALIGSITQSGTTAVLYNTTSDARLKENIAAADNGSALIDSLQVRKFDWKADGSHQRFGFVAQELDSVYPEAVSKPADPDEMMGVDYSKLVPLLVQEIQSLRARVAALETV